MCCGGDILVVGGGGGGGRAIVFIVFIGGGGGGELIVVGLVFIVVVFIIFIFVVVVIVILVVIVIVILILTFHRCRWHRRADVLIIAETGLDGGAGDTGGVSAVGGLFDDGGGGSTLDEDCKARGRPPEMALQTRRGSCAAVQEPHVAPGEGVLGRDHESHCGVGELELELEL